MTPAWRCTFDSRLDCGFLGIGHQVSTFLKESSRSIASSRLQAAGYINIQIIWVHMSERSLLGVLSFRKIQVAHHQSPKSILWRIVKIIQLPISDAYASCETLATTTDYLVRSAWLRIYVSENILCHVVQRSGRYSPTQSQNDNLVVTILPVNLVTQWRKLVNTRFRRTNIVEWKVSWALRRIPRSTLHSCISMFPRRFFGCLWEGFHLAPESITSTLETFLLW